MNIPALLALLLPTPTRHAPERHEISRGLDESLQMRTTSEILFGCIITIFLCSSYCIRPNISSPNASNIRVLGRKLNVSFWMILCPELIIIWALKQWREANTFASKYSGNVFSPNHTSGYFSMRTLADRRWTVMHGQFVIMGGFLLFQDNRPVQVLSPQKFTDLLDSACIDPPSITKDEIKRKGSSLPILAAITLLQTLWFVTQCIARGARGLALTQLEMVTLYLASTHALLLFFWWQKPLDARNSIRLQLKRIPNTTTLHEWGGVETGVHRDFGRHHLFIGKQLKAFQNLEFPSKVGRTQHSLTGTLQDYLLAPKRLFHLIVGRILFDFGQLFIPEELDGEIIADGLLEVPTFYAPGGSFATLLLVAKTLAGSCFASAYIYMRFSPFPTLTDEMVWLAFSVISAGLQMFLVLFVISFMAVTISLHLLPCFSFQVDTMSSRISSAVGFIVCMGFLLSIVARMVLLIEAFVCLKSTNPATRLSVAWTNYIPHFS